MSEPEVGGSSMQAESYETLGLHHSTALELNVDILDLDDCLHGFMMSSQNDGYVVGDEPTCLAVRGLHDCMSGVRILPACGTIGKEDRIGSRL